MTTATVLLATHNGARWIETQLASIVAQTRTVDEIIIVDDASTDATLSIVERLLRNQPVPYSVVQRSAALGVSGNFADGLARTTGDIIFLSDQDDEWLPTKVQAVMDRFGQKPFAMAVFTDAVEVGADGSPTGRSLWEATSFSHYRSRAWSTDPLGPLLTGNSITGATLAIRAAVKPLILPFPHVGWHDAWIALILAAKFGAGSLEPLEEKLVRYRVHGTNLSGGLPPTNRWTGLRWYVERGVPAEQRDRASHLELVERLRQLDVDVERLMTKMRFTEARATLPANPVRRLPFVLSSLRDGSYLTYAAGRASAIADLLFYDASLGYPRPRWKERNSSASAGSTTTSGEAAVH